jgi:hypothetical protein
MYPSPNQEAGNNTPSAYPYDGASLYAAQELGENAPSAYDDAQSYANNTPAQAEMAAYQSPIIERRGLLEDLIAYPWRSVRSLCQPSLRTFARETLNARWGVICISIFALPVLSSLIALLLIAASHHATSGKLGGILLGPLIVIPLLFFIIEGMIWPLARHYQGRGTFLEQCYTTFLPLAPFFLLGSIVTILLATDSTSRIGAILVLIEFLLFIYSSILLVVSLKAIHGLTNWEAFALALLPMFSILAVVVILLIVAFMIASSSNNDSSNSNNNSDNKNNDQSSNTNSGISTYQQQSPYYRNNYWWWWGSPRYASSGTNQNQVPRSKIRWLCPACRYRRWVRQGPSELACLRCDVPMQATEATR